MQIKLLVHIPLKRFLHDPEHCGTTLEGVKLMMVFFKAEITCRVFELKPVKDGKRGKV